MLRSNRGQALIESLIVAPAILALIAFIVFSISAGLTYFSARHTAYEYLICKQVFEIKNQCFEKLVSSKNYFLPNTKINIQTESIFFDRHEVIIKIDLILLKPIQFKETLLL